MSLLEAAQSRIAELERTVCPLSANLPVNLCLSVEAQAQINALQESVQLLTEQSIIHLETIRSLSEKLAEAREQIALFKKQLFYPKRERYCDPANQGYLFETLADEATAPPMSTAAEDTRESPATPPKKDRKPSNRLVFPETLEKKVKDHPLPVGELPCSCCGKDRVIIDYETSRQLGVEPLKVFVIEDRRFKYACPHCRLGSEMETAPKPPAALEKGIFGPSFAALVTEWKYARHIPLYRMQEMFLGPLEQWVSRPLLCGLLRRTGEELNPLAECIRQRILSSYLIHIDETTIKMLVKGDPKAKTAYFWGYAGGTDRPFVYFDFSPSRGRDSPDKILSGYQGYIFTDGYSTYDSLAKDRSGELIHACCWAHARRKFFEALTTTNHPLVHEVLGWIQKLYDIEDLARVLTPDERKKLREKGAKPILDQIKEKLEEPRPWLRPNSALGRAGFYLLNQWKELNVYLTDGRVPIDNNLLERNYKAIATGKKNYLFLGRETAGPTAAILYTIVRNAMNHNLNVFEYLHDVLKRLPILVAESKPLDELLPDQWALANPENVMLNRIEENRAAEKRKNEKRSARRKQVPVCN